jgi:hypothetical protein
VTNSTNITVSWSGADDGGGSGIASFDISVSDNGGALQLWLDNTTDTTGVFAGEDGHTYGFYSVATDNVGHVEATPLGAQATTRIDAADTTPPILANVPPDQTIEATGPGNNDAVSLKLAQGGLLVLDLLPSREAGDLRLLDTVADRSVLRGTIKKARMGGDGITTLQSITAPTSFVNRLPSTSQTAAQVAAAVDELLTETDAINGVFVVPPDAIA